MGITRRSAGGSGAAAADVSSQKCRQMALALAEKELEIGKLKEERSEYKRKYEDLTSSLKALADGGGHGAPPPAAATAASGARAQDKTDKEDGLQDKNFPLKVHHRQGKPVVADSYGKIHEKVEDPKARSLRLRREAYHRDKRIRAALTPGPGPVAAVAPAASGARRTDDSSGASSARAQGNAGGQSSSASGAAAAAAEEEDRRDDSDEETAPEEPRSKKMKTCTMALD